MNIRLDCGCIYSYSKKQIQKYCPKHFRTVAYNAMAQQIKLRNAIIHQERIQPQQLREQKKKSRYYIKPLFR